LVIGSDGLGESFEEKSDGKEVQSWRVYPCERRAA
jgi:hypothetical protein